VQHKASKLLVGSALLSARGVEVQTSLLDSTEAPTMQKRKVPTASGQPLKLRIPSMA